MNHLKLGNRIAISFIFSMLLLSVSHAELLSDEKWSFDFKNVSIVDAFNEIKRQTGIEIVVRQKTTQPIMITYHNKNQSITQVNKELLRNVNHVSSINYSNDGELKSINIIIIGQGDRKDNMQVSNDIKQPTKMADEPKKLRTKTKLAKPPDAPKIIGLRSPPIPPPVF